MNAAPRAWILGLVLTSMVAGGAAAPIRTELAPRPHMRMKLEKSWFKVDVVEVELWFGARTRDRLRRLVRGHAYSQRIANQVVQTALGTGGAVVQMEFLREISLAQFLESLRENLTRARDAGLISHRVYAVSWTRVNVAFGPLARRGFSDGDRLQYQVGPDTLRTRLVSRRGQVLLDVTVHDGDARRALLAGFFVKGSDFREPLIRSLF